MAGGFKSASTLGSSDAEEHHGSMHVSDTPPVNSNRQAQPSDASTHAGIDQLEAFANDPANATGPREEKDTKADGEVEETAGTNDRPMSKGARRYADNREHQADKPPRETVRRTPKADESSAKPADHSDTGGKQHEAPIGGRPSSRNDSATPRATSHDSDTGGKQFAPPPNKPYQSGDINPGKAMGGLAKLGAGVQAYVKNNPGKVKGGGIAAFLIAAILMAFSPLIADFKLSTFMNNMTDHGFRHTTHAYMERQRLIMKYWLKEQIDPTFEKDHSAGISNYDRSMIRNLYGKLRGDERLKKELAKAGYHIETKTDLDWPKGRITKITYRGHELNAASFEVEYRYMFEPQSAADIKEKGAIAHDISLIADDVFRGSTAQKRRVARRLQVLTGVKLHWIDKTTLPVKELRNKIRNQAVVWILTHSGAARTAVAQLLAYMFGDDVDKSTAAELNKAMGTTPGELSTKELSKTTSKGLVKILGKLGFEVSNPIGWAALLVTANCLVSKVYTDLYPTFQQIAKDKASAEYMVKYIEMASALSQLHGNKEGNNTDDKSVGLFMELLNDKQNRDFALNNNYRRATGEDVPYYHTNDCQKGLELCDDKRGQTMVDGTAIGRYAKRASENPIMDSAFGHWVVFMGPTGYGTKYMCKAVEALTNLAADIVIGIFKATIYLIPPAKAATDKLTEKGSEFFMENVFMPVLGWLIPPVVDADTRGPALSNAVAAGAMASSSTYLREFCGNPTPGDPEAAKKCRLEGEALRASEGAIRQEDMRRQQNLPLWDKLASLSNPRSILSRFVVSTPDNPQELMARIANIPRLFFPPAMVQAVATANPGWFSDFTALAADPKGPPETQFDPTGQDVYGWTDTCLKNTKLNDGSNPNCAGFDRFDDSVACMTIVDITRGQDVPPECSKDLNAQTAGGAPVSGDSKSLAAALLASPNIAFGDCWDAAQGKKDCSKVKQDLEITAAGGTIQNADSCNNPVTLHPMLLNALYQASLKYKVTVDSFVTTHGGSCSKNYFHPPGRAMDIWYINDTRTQSSLARPGKYNQEFSEYIAQYLPPEGEILQAGTCYPINEALMKQRGIDYNANDTCDHIHISVGGKTP